MTYTAKQKAYFKRKAIRERQNARQCCCAGCDRCAGFMSGCECDMDLESLRNALHR